MGSKYAHLQSEVIQAAGEPEEPACEVLQQEDTENTVPCSGVSDILNDVLRRMGYDIPIKDEPETYETSVVVKPKYTYASLNVSLSHGSLDAGEIDQRDKSQRITVSSGSWTADGDKYVIDLNSSLDLADSDEITSASWASPPTDDDLAEIVPPPSLSVDQDNKLTSSANSSGIILIRYFEVSTTYRIEIPPRDGATENFYQSYLVIESDGCEGGPTFYKVNVPDCYEQQQRIKNLIDEVDDGDGDTEVEDPPPKNGPTADVDHEWCMCTMKWISTSPDSAKPEDADKMCYKFVECGEDNCKAGSNHNDCE